MADIIFVIIGVTAGTGLLIGSIITTYWCCKRSRQNQILSNSQPLKQQRDQDYLHTVIINQHIARHLRPTSAVSFISDDYHHDMTLMAPPRRLAMLEEQQQGPATLVIENPLLSVSIDATERRSVPERSYGYENPTLELGELPTTSTLQF